MALSGKRGRERRGSGGVRPYVLAGGLGLMWFVQGQQAAMPTEAPAWGLAMIVGGRLLADFVCALVVVSAVRLAFAAARLGIAQWRAQRVRGNR